VFYPQPLPCISDVDEAVACLDHSGIRKLARSGLKHKRGLPFPSVQGDGNVQRPALFRGMIINEQVLPTAERHGIDAGIRIGQGSFPSITTDSKTDKTIRRSKVL